MSIKKTKTAQEIKRAPLFFSINTSKFIFAEDGTPKEMQVLMCGSWNHPVYGPIIITADDIKLFKQNFDAGLRRDIPITEGHESFDEKPAIGWFKELIDKGEGGLWAITEWTEKGKTLLSEKAYKYFSPEFYTEYEDPETREIYKDVLVGGALTNKPYFKKMSAVVLSEQSINHNYTFSDMLDLKTITAKKVEELSAEEKAFLIEHKAELSTEELATFGSVLEPEETAEQKAEREEKEKGDANEAAGLNRDGSPKETTTELTQEQKDANVAAGLNEDGTAKVDASEKNFVKIPASEYKALSDMANKGSLAFKELRENKIKAEASKLIFNEQNSKGKILPKSEAQLFSFMLGLTDAQRKTFAEIVEAIPSSQLFDEKGSGNGTGEATAAGELTKKVEKLMSEDKQMSYSDAVKKVLASDAGLSKRYAEENAVSKS